MFRAASHSRLAIAATLLQLALSFGLTFNLVVCRSTSGHVAIESGLSDCCTGAPSADDVAVAAGSECDGCTDTPLLPAVLQRDRDPRRDLSFSPRLIYSSAPACGLPPIRSSFTVRHARGAQPAPAPGTRLSVVLVV